jgi:hypothetical protein
VIAHTIVPVDLLSRIRQEFFEMPGLCLTQAQALRLWQLDDHTCAAVFAALVQRGFLMRTSGGAYLRRGLSRHRFLRASGDTPEFPATQGADQSAGDERDGPLSQ